MVWFGEMVNDCWVSMDYVFDYASSFTNPEIVSHSFVYILNSQ